MSGTIDEYRTGSADSENSSDNSYVQVSREDVNQTADLLIDPLMNSESVEDVPPGPAFTEVDDMYGGIEEDISKEDGQEEEVPPAMEPPEKVFGVNFEPSQEQESDDEEEMPESKVPEETTPPPPETPPPASGSDVHTAISLSSGGGIEDVPRSFTPPPLPPRTSAPPTEASVDMSSEPPKAGEILIPSGYLSFLHHLSPYVIYVIYWQDIKLSAVILGVCLMILFTLSLNTFIHTIVLLELSFLVVTLTYIVSKIAIDSFHNREIQNPFKSYLNNEVVLPEDKIVEWTRYLIKKAENRLNLFVKLMLFHNIKLSLKYGVILWLISFVTNYITILMALFLGVAMLFFVPPIYHKFQPVIDAKVDTAHKKLSEVFTKVRSHIPSYVPLIGKPKSE